MIQPQFSFLTTFLTTLSHAAYVAAPQTSQYFPTVHLHPSSKSVSSVNFPSLVGRIDCLLCASPVLEQ